MIKLKQVSKGFGGARALEPVDLEIPQGWTTVLIGPSGCGKSTLLRLVVGLISPDTGVVEFEGQPLDRSSLVAVRRRTGYVIQDGGLFPHLTAEQNVTLMARHLAQPRKQIDERLEQLAALTKFPRDGLAKFPAELSGGQRQRVALMRALMLDPDLLLLDEPLGALDPMVRSELQSDLKEIFARLQKTVVLVTHDMAEAAYLGDFIVLMREGRIVQQGTLADFQQRPLEEFVTRFLSAQRTMVQI